MSFSHPELLHRCVLALTILHVTLVYSLVSKTIYVQENRVILCSFSTLRRC